MRSWLTCKRDISVTLIVTVLAFLFGIKLHDILVMLSKQIDALPWPIVFLFVYGNITTMIFVLIETLFVHIEHYWQWSMVSLFSVTFARILNEVIRTPSESNNLYSLVWGTVVNGIWYMPAILPVIFLVFIVRKKVERR